MARPKWEHVLSLCCLWTENERLVCVHVCLTCCFFNVTLQTSLHASQDSVCSYISVDLQCWIVLPVGDEYLNTRNAGTVDEAEQCAVATCESL